MILNWSKPSVSGLWYLVKLKGKQMKLCRQFCLQKIVKTKEVKNKMIAYLLQCHLKDYKNVHARTSKPCSWLGVIQQLPGQNFIQFWPLPPSPWVDNCGHYTWCLPFRWPSMDFLLIPSPPLLVHVVIKWPLTLCAKVLTHTSRH